MIKFDTRLVIKSNKIDSPLADVTKKSVGILYIIRTLLAWRRFNNSGYTYELTIRRTNQMDSELRNKIAKAADFSRSNGWDFDKVGEKLNATHKVDALEQLVQQEIAKARLGKMMTVKWCRLMMWSVGTKIESLNLNRS